MDVEEKMDPVNKKELKGTHAQRKDKDINNDGKVDGTDKYLHARRKAISKNIKGNKSETATMNPKLDSGKGKSSEMEQKESTIRDKLMAVLEGDRSKHYKGATAPEDMDNNLKGAGAKKMKADIQGNAADPDLEKKSHDDAAKAGRAGPNRKMRPNDNSKGDSKVINPPADETKKGKGDPMVKEKYDTMSGLKSAYASMYEGLTTLEKRANDHNEAGHAHDNASDAEEHDDMHKDALMHHKKASEHHFSAQSHYEKGNVDKAMEHAKKAGQHSAAAAAFGHSVSKDAHSDTRHLHNQSRPLGH